MTELEIMTEGVFKAVNDYVARSIGPLTARIAELETRMASVKDGEPGTQGEKGDKGDDGKSVDVEILKEQLKEQLRGHVDIVLDDAIAKLPKAKDGEPGKDAAVDYQIVRTMIDQMVPEPIPAIKGDTGEKGDKGSDAVVDYEEISRQIALLIPTPIPGVKGDKGDKGEPGTNGENGVGTDGNPGRDALEIEPLSEIDFTRSYARRTYAIHRGGLWICRRSLPGESSWECVFDGVADLAFDETDNIRTLALSVETSSGRKIALEKRIPMLIFKGVWAAGEYELGDVVQRDGSMWHAKKATTAEPGILDAAKDWQLLVKRGQDGKNLTERSDSGNSHQKVIRIK